MVATKRRILVIEDDTKTAEIVRLYLERDGYEVLTAYDGVRGLELAREENPDLIVLDLLLPGLSGLQACGTIRRESGVPIIMLTAMSAEDDKLRGLELGADDYVTKPFSPRELAARVRAVLRRTTEEEFEQGPREVQWAGLNLDFRRHKVNVDGREVQLTPTEFRILGIMAREPGRVFSRSQLVDRALGYDFEGLERTVDVHILNLRRKIESDSSRPQYIRTIYGTGYKLGA